MLDCAAGAGARGLLQSFGNFAGTPATRQAQLLATPHAAADWRVLETVNLLSRAIATLTSP